MTKITNFTKHILPSTKFLSKNQTSHENKKSQGCKPARSTLLFFFFFLIARFAILLKFFCKGLLVSWVI